MSGSRANKNGARLELFVELTLQECEYKKSENGKELFKHRDIVNGQFYARGVCVGRNAYGGTSKRIVDWLIVNRSAFDKGLIIECKWQQSKGSTDEKYPNLVNNIKETGVPTIVLIGGNGYKPEALAWLRKQVDKRLLLAVWSMEEFYIAVNNGFFGTGDVRLMPAPPVSDPQSLQPTLWEEGA